MHACIALNGFLTLSRPQPKILITFKLIGKFYLIMRNIRECIQIYFRINLKLHPLLIYILFTLFWSTLLYSSLLIDRRALCCCACCSSSFPHRRRRRRRRYCCCCLSSSFCLNSFSLIQWWWWAFELWFSIRTLSFSAHTRCDGLIYEIPSSV